MRKSFISILILFSVISFSNRLFYYNNGIISPYDCGGDTSIENLFIDLSSPASAGLNTYVPKNILLAYFVVDTALVIDIDSKNIVNYSMEEEFGFVNQVLYTLFNNVKGIDRIYILLDGKKSDFLVRYVDTRWSFPKEIWNWGE